MKCVICHSPNIAQQMVNEEIWVDENVTLVPLTVLVCDNCGERYYDRAAMRKLEEAQKAVREKRWRVETTGQVLRVVTEPANA